MWAVPLVWVAGCAEAPPPVIERTPLASRPVLTEVLHCAGRPSRSTGSLVLGALRPVAACPGDETVGELPAGGGVVVRFKARVPLELGVRLETAVGQRRAAQPEELADEEAWARRGQSYYYEDLDRTRQAKTGAEVERQIALWPGADAAEGRLELYVKTISYDQRSVGADRESAPLLVTLVRQCPDLAIELGKEEAYLRQGGSRRISFDLRPRGEGSRTTKTSVQLDPLPEGLTGRLIDPVQSSSDWTNRRTTVLELTAARTAQPGTHPVTVRARLGRIERVATFQLTIDPVSQE
jgi:hypothetical protein